MADEDIQEVIEEYEMELEGAVENFEKQLASLRTGRATPAILDMVRVDYADKYAKDYIWMDWNELNTIAWQIYEDEKYAGKDYLKLVTRLLLKQSQRLFLL